MDSVSNQLRGPISPEEVDSLFGTFAKEYVKERKNIEPVQVTDALCSICNTAFRNALKAVHRFKDYTIITSLAAGSDGCILYRDYQTIVEKTLRERWQLKISRHTGKRLTLTDDQTMPEYKSPIKQNRRWCYDYKMTWELDNPHLTSIDGWENLLNSSTLNNAASKTGSLNDENVVILHCIDRFNTLREHQKPLAHCLLIPGLREQLTAQRPEEDSATARIHFPCAHVHFHLLLNFMSTASFTQGPYPIKSPLDMHTYFVLGQLANTLRYAPMLRACCYGITTQLNKNHVLEAAAYATTLKQSVSRYPIEAQYFKEDYWCMWETVDFLLAHCANSLYKHPTTADLSSIDAGDEKGILHLYEAAVELKHPEIQQQCLDELHLRVQKGDDQCLFIFQLLTVALSQKDDPSLAQIHRTAAKNLHLPCSPAVQHLLRPCGTLRRGEAPKEVDLDILLDLFRLCCVCYVAGLSEWCVQEVCRRFNEENWIPILATATECLSNEKNLAKCVWEKGKHLLLKHPTLMREALPADASPVLLAQIVWLGEICEQKNTMVIPAAEALIKALRADDSSTYAIEAFGQRIASSFIKAPLLNTLSQTINTLKFPPVAYTS